MFRRETRRDKCFLAVVYLLLSLAGLITLYPFYYVFCVSISEPVAFFSQGVTFWPRGISITSYKAIFMGTDIWRVLGNTLIITVTGTALALALTSMGGYVLSRTRLVFKRFFTFLVLIPMYFSGGMIPSYLLINWLGLMGTYWAVILSGALGTYYLILSRSYFVSLPKEIEESAWLDGANDFIIFARIMLPLAKPIMAVLLLYYAVGFWNVYFNAILYLPDSKMQPIQVYLASIIINNESVKSIGMLTPEAREQASISNQLKYSLIIVGITPIILVYPLIQKHLVKGMMLGSLKG